MKTHLIVLALLLALVSVTLAADTASMPAKIKDPATGAYRTLYKLPKEVRLQCLFSVQSNPVNQDTSNDITAAWTNALKAKGFTIGNVGDTKLPAIIISGQQNTDSGVDCQWRIHAYVTE